MNLLAQYHWPENIRELQNLVERAVVLTSGSVLKLPLKDLQPQSAAAADHGKLETLDQAERNHILKAMDASGWAIPGAKGAAVFLWVKRSTLPRTNREVKDFPGLGRRIGNPEPEALRTERRRP